MNNTVVEKYMVMHVIVLNTSGIIYELCLSMNIATSQCMLS